MSYKWLLLTGALMAAVPVYLLVQGDGMGAAIVGIPSFLICAAAFGCIRVLSVE